jgi:hypothetical protein
MNATSRYNRRDCLKVAAPYRRHTRERDCSTSTHNSRTNCRIMHVSIDARHARGDDQIVPYADLLAFMRSKRIPMKTSLLVLRRLVDMVSQSRKTQTSASPINANSR